jgi:hypothetical protein
VGQSIAVINVDHVDAFMVSDLSMWMILDQLLAADQGVCPLCRVSVI